MQEKRFLFITCFVGVILLIPLIAMQFTDEVNWNLPDFIVAGLLLFGLGIILDFTSRKINHSKNRVLIWIVIVVCFLLIWAELAVGIFGTPFAGD